MNGTTEPTTGLSCQICGNGDETEIVGCGFSLSKKVSSDELRISCPFECVVHRSCYRFVKGNQEDSFLCDACLYCTTYSLNPESISCICCHRRCGALKRTEQNEWVHMQCLLWGLKFKFQKERHDEVISCCIKDQDNSKQICTLCGRPSGVVVNCGFLSRNGQLCCDSVHVTCGQEAGYELVALSKIDRLPVKFPTENELLFSGGNEYKIYCKQHSSHEYSLADRLRGLCSSCWMLTSKFNQKDGHLWRRVLIQLMWAWRTAEHEVICDEGGERVEELLSYIKSYSRKLHECGSDTVEFANLLNTMLKSAAFGHFSNREIEFLVVGLKHTYENLSEMFYPMKPYSAPTVVQCEKNQVQSDPISLLITNEESSGKMMSPAPKKRRISRDRSTETEHTSAHVHQISESSHPGNRSLGKKLIEISSKHADMYMCHAHSCTHVNEGAEKKKSFMVQCSCCQYWYHPWCLGHTKNNDVGAWFIPNPTSFMPIEISLGSDGLPKRVSQWFCKYCYSKVGNIVVTYTNGEEQSFNRNHEGYDNMC